MRPLLVLLLCLPAIVAVHAQPDPLPLVRIAEVVAAPLTDWNDDGKVTPSDEFVELVNEGDAGLDLAGWRLWLNDSTPETQTLAGTLAAGGRLAFVNPPGEVNNNAHIALIDPQGRVVDEIRYGTWPGANLPGASSTTAENEALRLVDATWSRGHATPNAAPLGPTLRHKPPFESVTGQLWDPGSRRVAWVAEWADADHRWTQARIEANTPEHAISAASPAVYANGRGRANGTLVTPSEAFQWRIVLVDAEGRECLMPAALVKVDRDPPSAPTLVVPEWTNDDHPPVRATATTDEGVGGVEYALESREGEAVAQVRAWSTDPDFGPLEASNKSSMELRVVARDAYAHQAAGAWTTVRFDRTPPAPPNVTTTGGYTSIRLHWPSIADDASGTDHVVVRRIPPNPRQWLLAANATDLEDDTFRLGDRLSYAVRAVDRAGNAGNETLVNVSYEGERPHVRNLRVSRNVWGAGTLRVHADFDRAMDATTDADLRVAGERRYGRWLANHSTYLVELDAFEGPPRARVEVDVQAARDEEGRDLWAPAQRVIDGDGAAPTLESSDVNGWVNATGLSLRARDAGEAHLRYRLENETEWTESGPSIVLPIVGATRLRAEALDDAGWHSRPIDRTARLDDEAPDLGPPALSRGALRIPVQDSGAGVNESGIHARGGGRLLAATVSDGFIRIPLDGDVDVHVDVRDRVGNLAALDWSPPRRSSPTSSPAVAEPPYEGVAHEAGLALPPPATTHGAPVHWDATKTGGVGLAALALVVGTVRARRRRPRAGSLAARIRRARLTRRRY